MTAVGEDAVGEDPGRDTGEGESGGETAPGKRPIDRARLARIFGDVLPETTRDERGPGEERSGSEEWLRRQVPPHHGNL